MNELEIKLLNLYLDRTAVTLSKSVKCKRKQGRGVKANISLESAKSTPQKFVILNDVANSKSLLLLFFEAWQCGDRNRLFTCIRCAHYRKLLVKKLLPFSHKVMRSTEC